MTNTKIELADHTFTPWRLKDGKCVLASEAKWRQPARWDRAAFVAHREANCAAMATTPADQVPVMSKPLPRPRVLLGVDPFEDWTGPIVNSRGERLSRIEGACEITVTMSDVCRRLFSLIDATPNLDWLLLTKRPENIRRMWPKDQCGDCHAAESRGIACGPCDNTGYVHDRRENVWLGTSISTQADSDRNIPELLKCRDLSPLLFLSIEPLLGPIDLTRLNDGRNGWLDCLGGVWGHGLSSDGRGDGEEHIPDGTTGNQIIDWVICGGESGPNARPMHPDWVRSIRDQCQAAGVPFFFSQWGEWLPGNQHRDGAFDTISDVIQAPMAGELDGVVSLYRVGTKAAGRLLDGRTWDEFPSMEVQR